MFEPCVQAPNAPLNDVESDTMRQQQKIMLDYKLFANTTLQLDQNNNSSSNGGNNSGGVVVQVPDR